MNWIHKLGDPGDLLLTDLILPGTHDSAAYQIDWSITNILSPLAPMIYLGKKTKYLKNSITKWGITQNLNIYEQLCTGARFLDLRVVHINNIWYLHHEIISISLEIGLYQILQFIEESQEPVVISILPRNLNKNNINSLVNLFSNIFENKIWDKDQAPIKEMQRTGKLLYLILDHIIDIKIPTIFRTHSSYLNIWYRTTDPDVKIRFLYTFLEKLKSKEAYVNITFTLTPSIYSLIINLFFKKSSLKSIDKTMKEKLQDFLTHQNINKANTITFDFFSQYESDLVQSLNFNILLKSRVKKLIS